MEVQNQVCLRPWASNWFLHSRQPTQIHPELASHQQHWRLQVDRSSCKASICVQYVLFIATIHFLQCLVINSCREELSIPDILRGAGIWILQHTSHCLLLPSFHVGNLKTYLPFEHEYRQCLSAFERHVKRLTKTTVPVIWYVSSCWWAASVAVLCWGRLQWPADEDIENTC